MRHVLISPWSRGLAFGLSGVKYKNIKSKNIKSKRLFAIQSLFAHMYKLAKKVVMPIAELETNPVEKLVIPMKQLASHMKQLPQYFYCC